VLFDILTPLLGLLEEISCEEKVFFRVILRERITLLLQFLSEGVFQWLRSTKLV